MDGAVEATHGIGKSASTGDNEYLVSCRGSTDLTADTIEGSGFSCQPSSDFYDADVPGRTVDHT
jgi:hypothetical protein